MFETWHIITYIVLSSIVTLISGAILQVENPEDNSKFEIGFVFITFFLWWGAFIVFIAGLIIFIMELFNTKDPFVKIKSKYRNWSNKLPEILQFDIGSIIMLPINKIIDFLALKISLFSLKENLEELKNLVYCKLNTQEGKEELDAELKKIGVNKKYNWRVVQSFIYKELEAEYKIKKGPGDSWITTTPVEIAKMRIKNNV